MELCVLYLLTFLCAAALTAGVMPLLVRGLSPLLTDRPGGLKTHARAVPMVGGCAVFAGTIASLVLVRLVTNFPTGTLHSLRGILGGGTLIFILGLLDDLRKPKGLPVWLRLLVQAGAGALLIYYGVYVQIFSCAWLNYVLTFLWLCGLTNAFNLLDILDGLCISQALICATGLLLIALPGETGYLPFAVLALLGAGLAFWPHNHAAHPVFLGDSGATFIGFFIAALSMAAQYSHQNPYGYTASLFIVAVPLLDTAFVTSARVLQGKNPLQGSPDHLALRLKACGNWSDRHVLLGFALAGILCNALAYLITHAAAQHTPAAVGISLLGAGIFLLWLLQKYGMLKH